LTELAAVLPGAEARWKPLSRLRGRRVPQNVLHWLADDGSLTRRLQAACGPAFRVRVLHQGWGRPQPSEARLLHMRRGETAMLREVELCCGTGVWVFARTVIPARSLRGPLRRLATLGARPLGAVLFSDPALRRGPTQTTHLLPGHALFQAAAVSLAVRPPDLWGRRSLFFLAGKPLLVNEIFLPALVAAHGEGADA
jgi:chorismate--pyruvate lyase